MEEGKVIGIHIATLESLIRGIIKEELSCFEGKVQNLYLQPAAFVRSWQTRTKRIH